MRLWSRYFTTPSRLRSAGVLGMNARNFEYIMPGNPRRFYPRVDDKLLTKTLALKHGIRVPELFGAIEFQHEVKSLFARVANLDEFVIKPTRGSGGRGILVAAGRTSKGFVKTDGEVIGFDRVYQHVSNILSGLYSLGGQNDRALIERRIHVAPAFDGFSYRGLPDIRIVIYRGYPVMAMIRLATAASDGRANLHQGAIGVGLSLNTGKPLDAVCRDQHISVHPDTGRRLDELAVPRWTELLQLAARCYEITGLAYFGADLVIDRELGPMLLELNARPGLSIQTANGTGLRNRLLKLDALPCGDNLPPAPERVALAIDTLFPA
jgi:alpha-L-glutamate ligase-like protein